MGRQPGSRRPPQNEGRYYQSMEEQSVRNRVASMDGESRANIAWYMRIAKFIIIPIIIIAIFTIINIILSTFMKVMLGAFVGFFVIRHIRKNKHEKGFFGSIMSIFKPVQDLEQKAKHKATNIAHYNNLDKNYVNKYDSNNLQIEREPVETMTATDNRPRNISYGTNGIDEILTQEEGGPQPTRFIEQDSNGMIKENSELEGDEKVGQYYEYLVRSIGEEKNLKLHENDVVMITNLMVMAVGQHINEIVSIEEKEETIDYTGPLREEPGSVEESELTWDKEIS